MRDTPQGYDIVYNENTNEHYAIQRSTGEVTNANAFVIPEGSRIITPEEQVYIEKKKENKRYRKLRRSASKGLGNFFFIPSAEDFDGISPESVTKLIYLNTFIDYDNNKLMLSERTPMQRKDLHTVLKVSKPTISRFWREVSPTYIVEQDDGLMFTNKNIFIRGKLNKQKGYDSYQKMYINGIRKLYQTTDISNHRHLGHIFKLLPFINIEFNVLCYNPLETDMNQIDFMSITEFCNIIKYDISHLNRLLALYRKICFDVGDNQERFCALSYDGINRNTAKIFINPHILYSGTNYKQVEILGAFVKNS